MIDWEKTEEEFGINRTNYKFNSTVAVICDGCGVSGHKKIRSKKNVTDGQMAWKCMKCHLDNPVTKSKKSKNSKKMWAENRDKIINSINYAEIARKAREKWKDKKFRDKVLGFMKKNSAACSERMKKQWQDEEYRNKMMRLYRTQQWSESRSRIANEAWANDDYRNCILEHNKKKRITKIQFLERAKNLYGDKYDYSEIDYETYNVKIKIICPDHGEFWQVPSFHIKSKCGCPVCAGTHLQVEVYEFVTSLESNVVNNDRSTIAPNELDILMPEKSLAIEVNGLYWHSYNHVEDHEERNRHLNKLDKCIAQNISLIQITEQEWREKRQIVESIIRNKMGKSSRIYARKCELVEITIKEYRKFINENHMQGYKHAHAICGLEYDSELVAVMSFNRHKKYGWEITRFVNKLGYAVVGGASRLFKKFIRDHDPDTVMTYADRRYSDGNLYRKLGFELDGVTKPNYCYIKGVRVFSRQQFQKHKLKDRLKVFDPNLTEAENMFNNGFRRMWDAGHFRFLWSRFKK